MNDIYTKVKVNTVFLEIFNSEKPEIQTNPEVKFSFVKEISNSEYLEIYNRVGWDFGWAGRLILNAFELEETLKSVKSNIYLMYFKGSPAGFYEFDLTNNENVELVYFGLFPEFYANRLGRYLISSAIENAFVLGANRLFLHTCEYDSPAALPFYKKSGFKVYKTIVEEEYYLSEFIEKNKKTVS